MSAEIEETALLRALGHPVRLSMMRQLAAEPETCACDFTDVFSIAQPTVSQHLKVLREARLVRTRRRGNQICYSVDTIGVERVRAIVDSIRELTSTT